MKRQDVNEQLFVDLLNKTRNDLLDEKSIAFMKRYHVDYGNLTGEERAFVKASLTV